MPFSICCWLDDFLGDVVHFLCFVSIPSIILPFLIWAAAMLNQLWNLNFYVWQSGAMQNIYKSLMQLCS